MLRRHFIFAVFFFPLLGAEVAHAATEARFDQTSFLAAQKAGSPILVHIAASWCPICAVQRPILQKLSADIAKLNTGKTMSNREFCEVWRTYNS